MESINEMQDVFVQCWLKDWKNLTNEENEIVYKRKRLLNDQFVFTDIVIQQLRKINSILKNEETRVLQQSKAIYVTQKKWLEEKGIDDYEAKIELTCWNDSYYTLWNQEFEGNPFFCDDSIVHFTEEFDEIFCTDNWNEFQFSPEHPLAKEFHCYMLHHLYNHTPLAGKIY